MWYVGIAPYFSAQVRFLDLANLILYACDCAALHVLDSSGDSPSTVSGDAVSGLLSKSLEDPPSNLYMHFLPTYHAVILC